ncbi:MAG: hypothetical protein ACYTAN_10400 [Planctomycetota bacterium]|jgi:hypothetical protein
MRIDELDPSQLTATPGMRTVSVEVFRHRVERQTVMFRAETGGLGATVAIANKARRMARDAVSGWETDSPATRFLVGEIKVVS